MAELNTNKIITKKDIAFRRCHCSDFSQKKDIAFRRCHCSDFSQKKTLPFGDVSFWGARTDSNRRHSEPQADLRMSHKPCIHRCFRNFRFLICGYFAAIYARTDSVSINLVICICRVKGSTSESIIVIMKTNYYSI